MSTLPVSFDSDTIVRVLAMGFLGFSLSMLLTPLYTTAAYAKKWWKKPRENAVTGEKAKIFNQLHAAKHARHIPTMAGMIAVVAVGVVTAGFNLIREQTLLPLGAMLGAGAVGLLDDIINLRGSGKGVAGLRSKLKLLLITIVALIGGLWFHLKLDGYDIIHLTFLGDINVGWLIIPIFTFVVIATANAVNISDGLDGLAGGLLVSAFSAYGFIAFLQQRYGLAGFCLAMVGALLAYVWFNIFPARFFMGDIGSFAFGTALGVVAMLTNTLALLPIIGLVFVVEAGSSMLQILSKKLRNGKKIFKVAPIHHHFEALGWPEAKVTMRFWVIGQVMAVLGLILFIIGGHL